MLLDGRTRPGPLLIDFTFLWEFLRTTTTVMTVALEGFARCSMTEWLVSRFQSKVPSYLLTGCMHRAVAHWEAPEV